MKSFIMSSLLLASVGATVAQAESFKCTQNVYGKRSDRYASEFLGKVKLKVTGENLDWGSDYTVTFDASDLAGRGNTKTEYTIKVTRKTGWMSFNTMQISNVIRTDGGSEIAHSYVTIREPLIVEEITRVLAGYTFPRYKDRWGNDIPGTNGYKVEDGGTYWSFRELKCERTYW